MCGRYTLTSPGAALAELFELSQVPELRPRYNIAPTQEVPVVREQGSARELARVRWGLVPPWVPDPAIGVRMINARAETLAAKPAFRDAFRQRRCLVPADGFFEWKKVGRAKYPHYVHRHDRMPFAFAGLWERWESSGGAALETCTIVTTTPSPKLAELHDRMPAILPRSAFATWLDSGATEDDLRLLLIPAPDADLEIYEVGPLVNRVDNEAPELLEPAPAIPTVRGPLFD